MTGGDDMEKKSKVNEKLKAALVCVEKIVLRL